MYGITTHVTAPAAEPRVEEFDPLGVLVPTAPTGEVAQR